MKQSSWDLLTPTQKETRILLNAAYDHVAAAVRVVRAAGQLTGEFELEGLGGLMVSVANQIQGYIDRMERSVEDVEASRR